MFSLIRACIKGLANHRDAGNLRCHRIHYDVTVMGLTTWPQSQSIAVTWHCFHCIAACHLLNHAPTLYRAPWLVSGNSHAPALWRHNQGVSNQNIVMLPIFKSDSLSLQKEIRRSVNVTIESSGPQNCAFTDLSHITIFISNTSRQTNIFKVCMVFHVRVWWHQSMYPNTWKDNHND